jgi:uncharacterized membrane protein
MKNQPTAKFNKIFKVLFAYGLIGILFFANAGDAWAKRTGGRVGGGSFNKSSPSRNSGSGNSGSDSGSRGNYNRGGNYNGGGGNYGGGGYGYGGGYYSPIFFNAGSLLMMLVVLAIAAFLVRSMVSKGIGGGSINELANPKVSIAQVQVGLLATARSLQEELNRLTLTADTATPEGRAMVLQEAVLSLLRYPEYWYYGAAESRHTTLDAAEAQFNQLSLTERSKFSEETLSNYGGNLLKQAQKQLSSPNSPENDGSLSTRSIVGDYIIVTVLLGIEGNIELPQVNSAEELRQALQILGGVGSNRLMVIEILWTPQADGDTLTNEDILEAYPNLKLV